MEGRTLFAAGAIAGVTLIDAYTGETISNLRDGAVLNLANFPAESVDIRVKLKGRVDGVRFDLNGARSMDKWADYSLRGKGRKRGDWLPEAGEHELRVVSVMEGKALGKGKNIRFRVIDVDRPDSPRGLTADATESAGVRLYWKAKSPEQTLFRISRSKDGKAWQWIGEVRGGTSFTDKKAGNGEGFVYRVRAYNEGGRSGFSEAARISVVEKPEPPTAPEVPAAPAALRTTAAFSSIRLTWADLSDDEEGFIVYRSSDGETFSKAATLPADASAYTDENVPADEVIYYRVNSYNKQGESASGVVAGEPLTPPTAPLPEYSIPAPAQSVVDAAVAYPLIRYNRSIAGGAHTNQPAAGGAAVVLAAAAMAGNTSADARLLQQIRYTLTGGNEITANGGYPAQHERNVTAMFVLVKRTPRIWGQLSDFEKRKIDLLMKASLIASAFTTGDRNPYILAGRPQRALDGDGNLSRTWNPNYREGMVGGMLVAMVYFGGADEAERILADYDHEAFVAELKEAGLTNLAETFNWKADHATASAPTGEMIEAAVEEYRYYGIPLGEYMTIYGKLASNTFGQVVAAGLNGGAGFNGGGKILSGVEGLPNLGAVGMLSEFGSIDGGGPRSSAVYAYDGFRAHLINHYVLVVGGYWDADAPAAADALARMSVGATDLWYKLEHGYTNYQKGAATGTTDSTQTHRGFEFIRPLWEDVVRAYHRGE